MLSRREREVAMPKRNWDAIVNDLHDVEDLDLAVSASAELDRAATASRLPQLYELLRDKDFFVREAAAVPISRLDGLKSLPDLLQAYERGGKEGHDNDGLTTTIISVVEENPRASARLLVRMLDESSTRRKADAAWLMGFVSDELSPEPLLRLLKSRSPAVRSCAAGSLSSFKGDNDRTAVLEGLITAAADENEQVRVSAVSSLGYLGDSRAMPALNQARRDRSQRVRDFARSAIEQLKK